MPKYNNCSKISKRRRITNLQKLIPNAHHKCGKGQYNDKRKKKSTSLEGKHSFLQDFYIISFSLLVNNIIKPFKIVFSLRRKFTRQQKHA